MREYYREPQVTLGEYKATLLADTILPFGLSVQEEQEACRAIKGQVLRQEIYTQDNSPLSQHPYSVSEHNYELKLIQPILNNRHGVFFAHPSETIDYHSERQPEDPRVSHQLTMVVDEFGNVTDSIAIAYPRRTPEFPEQGKLHITYNKADFINKVDVSHYYYVGIPYQNRTYEITGINWSWNSQNPSQWLTKEAFKAIIANPNFQPYEWQRPAGFVAVTKRIIEWKRSYFRQDAGADDLDESDNLTYRLPLGDIQPLGLPYESYQAAFTDALIQQIYQSRVTNAMIAEGKYHRQADQPEYWWIPSGRQAFKPDGFFLPYKSRDPFGNISQISYDQKYHLLIESTVDALGNTVVAENDYRMLQPRKITDPNGNRAAVAFDTLGMVVGTAVMGKEGENKGDSLEGFEPDLDDHTIVNHIQNPLANPHAILAKATTRLVYDLWAYYRTKQEMQNGEEHGQPHVVYTLARETHNADLATGELTKVQHSFLYSDGFGRELQTKIQAEPGPIKDDDPTSINPRWVGTGWKIYNNKGKPVKQYEPFFSDTHQFNPEQVGVSSTLFYDPLERVIATLHPNHTYEKVVFNPWQQTIWDVNDTVVQENPQNDPDVGGFFSALDEAEYLPTWYVNRKDGQLGTAEKDAATKAAVHANTPTVAYLDTLGRTFLTVADNGSFGKYETHIELDIEGNQRVVTDARGNQVMIYAFNMLSQQVYSHSMDAGDRWTFTNVAGNPIRAWDSRNHQFRHTYDLLQRSTHLFVQQGTNAEVLAERTIYGETHPDAVTLNLRGKVYQHYDGAGVITSERFDFKGNLLSSKRHLAQEYKQQVNWLALANLTNVGDIANAAAPLLEPETFTTSTQYDALNRPISLITPDNSETRPIYNEANLLEKVEVRLRGAATWTAFVNDIDYDAKGQRLLIEYGNGVRTDYTYDILTFRLTNLKTTRIGDNARLQDLSYTYDPVGNITAIRDDAQQTVFFNNNVVSPSTQYDYDALYRLIKADGREHIGQTTSPQPQYDYNDFPRINLPHPNNGQAMRNYTEQYQYDSVGNILAMIHASNGGSWTRRYEYDDQSNRLKSTSLPGDSDTAPYSAKYQYDAHGSMTQMPHLQQMQWDFKDQLQIVNLGGGGTAYYVYDTSGQRVRKVLEKSLGLTEERVYLGGYEIFRRRNGNGLKLERETLHILDDKQRIALVETKTVDVDTPVTSPTPLIRYQLDNHLGSVSLELDKDGQVISYEEYYPYGSTSYQAGRSLAEVSLKRYRYTGKERDEETGLYYHGARYYATWLGRWTAADPAGHIDGFNLYRYSRNNPVIFVDYTGCAPNEYNRTRGKDIAQFIFSLWGLILKHPWTAEGNAGKVGKPPPPPMHEEQARIRNRIEDNKKTPRGKPPDPPTGPPPKVNIPPAGTFVGASEGAVGRQLAERKAPLPPPPAVAQPQVVSVDTSSIDKAWPTEPSAAPERLRLRFAQDGLEEGGRFRIEPVDHDAPATQDHAAELEREAELEADFVTAAKGRLPTRSGSRGFASVGALINIATVGLIAWDISQAPPDKKVATGVKDVVIVGAYKVASKASFLVDMALNLEGDNPAATQALKQAEKQAEAIGNWKCTTHLGFIKLCGIPGSTWGVK